MVLDTPEHVIYNASLTPAAGKLEDTSVPDLDPSTSDIDPPKLLISDGQVNTTPTLGDGTPLPKHGIFGPNTVWKEWLLGDFTSQDSPIGNFIGSVPPSSATLGQINVYEISIRFTDGASVHGVWVHFDVYNHVYGHNHAFYRFAPFSHDADGDVTVIREPGSLVGLLGVLVGSGVLGGRSFLRRRKVAQGLP